MQGSIWQCLWVLIPALWLASWYWPRDQNKSRKCLSAHGKQNDSNWLKNRAMNTNDLSAILRQWWWLLQIPIYDFNPLNDVSTFFFCYKLIHRVASCLLVKIESLWWRSGLLQCRGEQRQPASCDTIAWRLGDPLANPRWFMRLSFSDYLGWILWSLENQIV